jgi:hypothetical protein
MNNNDMKQQCVANPQGEKHMSIEAMKQWLKALIDLTNEMIDQDFVNQGMDAIESLRQAIEQASSVSSIQSDKTSDAEKQEPVAWIKRSKKGNIIDLLNEPDDGAEPLYTTPQPQREWVGLTDEEIDKTEWVPLPKTQITLDIGWIDNMKVFARAIEAKLKERNHVN